MWHEACECEKGGGGLLLFLIYEGMSKSLVNSMAFAFVPIGTRTGSFAALAFTFVFAPIEAPQYVYILFHFFNRICVPDVIYRI